MASALKPSLDHAFAMEEKALDHSTTHAGSGLDRDNQLLARLGKKPVLRRRFGFLAIIGFTCTMLVTWEGSLILFTTGLTNGGSAGLVYGYIFVWIGTICVFTTMAEMASIAPTAGGQYHWVSMMAPPSCRNFLSYITGWLVIAGWEAILAGGGYLTGTMIVAIIQLNHPSYVPQQWHGTLLFWATIAYAVFFNTLLGSTLPKIELVMLFLHVAGFLAILIPLVACSPEKASAHDVFTQFFNGGAWPSQGLSFFIGLIGSVFAMFGCDATVHMAEEVNNAAVVVPWAMISTTLFNGAIGFGMILAVLFVTLNVDAALESPTGALGYPFMDIFYTATNSKGGANVMIAIVLVMSGAGSIAAMATASRIVWAFARDRGLPGWRTVTKLRRKTAIPMLSVIFTAIVTVLIGLINLGSSTAFNAVISLSVSGLYGSYLIVEVLMLYHRCTGGIRSAHDSATHIHEGDNLIWGPFHVPGIFGIAVNVFAVMFGIIIFFFSFWPVARPVTAPTMNYSILMTGSVVLFAVFYYVVWARKTFKGPIVEISTMPTSMSSR